MLSILTDNPLRAVSIPTLTTVKTFQTFLDKKKSGIEYLLPKGSVAPGKTFPDPEIVPGIAALEVPIKGSTYSHRDLVELVTKPLARRIRRIDKANDLNIFRGISLQARDYEEEEFKNPNN